MRPLEQRIYRESLELTARHVLTDPPEKLRESAFPFWQKAVHDILVLTGCQCVCHDSNEVKCFLSLDKELQTKLHMGGELSFEGFMETLDGINKLSLMNSLRILAHA